MSRLVHVPTPKCLALLVRNESGVLMEACLCEKMASWIGSQVVARVSLFSSACTSILISVLGVTMAVHWGSTTIVLIWSSKIAGPSILCPGRNLCRWYA